MSLDRQQESNRNSNNTKEDEGTKAKVNRTEEELCSVKTSQEIERGSWTH